VSDVVYQFDAFVVDRARYRVTRGETAVDLTPKLLDLLLYLLDHAGVLVTKEELLDALWPDANVTDNALAQAMSELRQAIGDDAGTPQYIKTVARRGYRFVAPVNRVESAPSWAPTIARPPAAPTLSHASVAVMDFANVSGDRDSDWLSTGIAETVSSDLRALNRFHVVDRRRVIDAARRTDGSIDQVAAALGIKLAVIGSYQRNSDRIRITARVVDVTAGDAMADAKVDGPLTEIFELQDRVVEQLSRELGLAAPPLSRTNPVRETTSLDAYRAFTEGWLYLESLDLRQLPQAVASFERAIHIDTKYALAFTGLATAKVATYESTRSENTPSYEILRNAEDSARRAIALDDTLAEAHATLGFVLTTAGHQDEARQAARRAVALEPSNWRHFFRLGHASWGEERLQAASNALRLYPDFAFAHFQGAMVHVARGNLREAEAVLRQGAAIQDRQIARGERYPALGLHWLLALVRLAQDDIEEACRELEHERTLAEPHRLYGREYAMTADWTEGACLLRLHRPQDAIAAFERALALYPEHAQSHLGLALALREAGLLERADETMNQLEVIERTLAHSRPVESAIVRAQVLTCEGNDAAAVRVLIDLLETAPSGFVAWTLPVEPFLHQVVAKKDFAVPLQILAERAR